MLAHVAALTYLPGRTLQLGDHQTYDLGYAGELQVTGAFTIDGNGSTIRQTCPGARVIHQMDNAALTLSDVTLTGGSLTATTAAGAGISGSDLTLLGVTVTGNRSTGDGGGVSSDMLHATDSTISSNSAGGAGGGVRRRATWITGSTITGNAAGTDGGGVAARIPTLDGTSLTNNTAGGDGGAIATDDVYAAGVTATDSTATGNHAGGAGGAVRSLDVRWTGGSLTSNTAHGNGGAIATGGTNGSGLIMTSLDHVTLAHNQSDAAGGGAYGIAYLQNSTVSDNHALIGGAFAGPAGANYTVSSSTIDANVATQSAGAFAVPHNGWMDVNSSTMTANAAPVGAAMTSDGTATIRMDRSVMALTPSGSLCSGAFKPTPGFRTTSSRTTAVTSPPVRSSVPATRIWAHSRTTAARPPPAPPSKAAR